MVLAFLMPTAWAALSAAIVAGCFWSSSASAQEPVRRHLVLHTVSHHYHAPATGDHWNAQNWGLGMRQEVGEACALQLGFYRNSNFGETAYVIGEWTPLSVGPLRAGIFGGPVTGYKVPVGGGLVWRLQWGDASTALRFVPKAYKSSSAVMSLEFGMLL